MSQSTMSRRDLLACGAAVAGMAASNSLLGEEKSSKPLFEISLAQWSLVRRLRNREKPHLDNLDFAKQTASYGIKGVEYVNQFFADKANDKSYLAEMKKRAADHGVKSLLIMVDNEGNLGNPNKSKRQEAVERHYKWVGAAKFLGCHSIRVNARSDAKLTYDEQLKLAVDGLRNLTLFAAKSDINVLVENHGGLSSNGKWLSSVLKAVDHPRCGALPDFGNFGIDRKSGEWYDRYQGVRELMPLAKAVSAKSNHFDAKRPFVSVDGGGERETDFLKMMRIVLQSGYRGWVGIESEGPGDQDRGVRQTLKMLVDVRTELAKEFS